MLSIKKWVPPYARRPLLIMVAWNMVVFYGSRLLTWNRFHHIFEITLDARVPVIPGFVYIYVMAFAQWIIGHLLIARDSEELCLRIVRADIIAKSLAFLVFLLYPTTNIRPPVPDGAFGSWLLRFIYMMDAPRQLFPSVHCLESWIVFRGSMYMQHKPRGYTAGMLVFTLLVFASTLFTHQHAIPDVIGGACAAEIGLAAVSIWKKVRRGH